MQVVLFPDALGTSRNQYGRHTPFADNTAAMCSCQRFRLQHIFAVTSGDGVMQATALLALMEKLCVHLDTMVSCNSR